MRNVNLSVLFYGSPMDVIMILAQVGVPLPSTDMQDVRLAIICSLFCVALAITIYKWIAGMIKAPPAADLPLLPAWWKMLLGGVVLSGIAVWVFLTIKHDLTANRPKAQERYDNEQREINRYQGARRAITNHYQP